MHFLAIMLETHYFTPGKSVSLLHWMQLPSRIWCGLQMRNDLKFSDPGPAANQGTTQTTKAKPKWQKPGGKVIKGRNFPGMWSCVAAWT